MGSRTGAMTDRERIEALLRREKPDRVPIWPFAPTGFAVVYTGTHVADAYNKPEVALAAQRKAAQDFSWVFIPWMGYAAYGCWEFGGEIKWPSSEFAQAPTISKYPVETEDDVWNLTVPDVKTAGIIPLMREFYKLSSQERLDNKPFNVSPVVGSAFTRAGNICGVDKLCIWLLKKPDVAHRLLRLATDHSLDLAEYWKNLFGVDGILPFTGEATSCNDLISPRQFEEFNLPYIIEIHEKLLAMGFKHIQCLISGDHSANLPYWAQVPMGDPGIVRIPHEIDLETAYEYFPNDIIVGNLEPAIIQTSTPEEVYRATSQVLEKGKTLPGGFVFSQGDDLPPMAPPVNVMAMTRAINDFGWHD